MSKIMSTTKFNRAALDRLKAANLPHMQGTDIAEMKENCEEARQKMAMLDDYLKAFVKGDGTCVCCGARQGGKDLLDGLLNARFQWGIAHGEGFCSVCGYPARGMHYIGKNEQGEAAVTIRNWVLQYHPDGLSFDKPKEEELLPSVNHEMP